MTRPRRSAKPASRWMGLMGLALLASPGLARAQPSDLYLERTAMGAVNARCALFTPQVAGALAAATQQARGAALRAGADPRTLAAQERDARARAARLDCRAPQVAAAAARVREAFAHFQTLSRMRYPGDVAGWRADRGSGRTARWRLAQDARFGADRMTFGLAGWDGANGLIAVASFADGATPYAARLVLRDATRTNGPYLPDGAPAAALSRKLPPRSATQAYMAEARSEAATDLLPRDAASGWAFRFPAHAAGALAGLDPREAVAVEFLFPGEQVRTAYVEVGDFAAGRAFLQMAAR